MSNERYNQIVDDAYENYSKEYEKDNSIGMALLIQTVDGKSVYRKPDREMFIGLCTHDASFSERWGLKIEERELSLEERVDYFNSKMIKEGIRTQIGTVDVDESYWRKALEETNHNIPTREITVTYNNETVEIYE
jgi:hypothetical protein